MLMPPADFAHYAEVGFSLPGLWSSLKWIGIPATCLLTIGVGLLQIIPKFRSENPIGGGQAGFAFIVYLFSAPLLAMGLTKIGWIAYVLNANLSHQNVQGLHDFIMSTGLMGLLISMSSGG
ncbi:MAG: hypothetical protein P1U36_10465 [Legionellaceae bacterium]|nr:hypothetical protein [Legionellaceae bacterium]